MKLYTKTGDQGQTRLVDGKVVDKHDIQVETYGTIDELNSFIGLFRSRLGCSADLEILAQQNMQSFLQSVQNELFNIGSILATENSEVLKKLICVSDAEILIIEKQIDELDAPLPALKNFILPGGHELACLLHICRTVCRRAERLCSKLLSVSFVENANPAENQLRQGNYILCLQYLNRLSDYFFIAARWMNHSHKQQDILWKTRS